MWFGSLTTVVLPHGRQTFMRLARWSSMAALLLHHFPGRYLFVSLLSDSVSSSFGRWNGIARRSARHLLPPPLARLCNSAIGAAVLAFGMCAAILAVTATGAPAAEARAGAVPDQRTGPTVEAASRNLRWAAIGSGANSSSALFRDAGSGSQPDSSNHECDGVTYNPTPTAVTVEAVPIVVTSTTADYFVLYVKHDVDGGTLEQPVAVVLGEDVTTTLAENVEALPAGRYRVEKYLIANPADVDGDCVDDITELGALGAMSPVNPAGAIALSDGAAAIPDDATLQAMTSGGVSAQRGSLFGKFLVFDADSAHPSLYFINQLAHDNHVDWLIAMGFDRLEPFISGGFAYFPELLASDGTLGVYYLDLRRLAYSFNTLDRVFTLFAANMPLLDNNLALYLPNWELDTLQSDLPLLRASRIPLLFREDVYHAVRYQVLNPGVGYGRLRVLGPGDRPHPRDVVIYEALPNELPRVAGIISTVPQTPLSHVNLRAIQDRVPNAFILDILNSSAAKDLVGKFVRYEVDEWATWTLRAATPGEVEAHYNSSRPAAVQTPERDLSHTSITPLSEIGFEHWRAFGVKAANVAVLRTLGFPAGTVPDGFAIPFYFYDEFMKHNGFYDRITALLANRSFRRTSTPRNPSSRSCARLSRMRTRPSGSSRPWSR